MKVNGFFLFLIIFLATLVLASIFYPLRYIKYLLPFLPLPFYFNSKKTAVDRSVLKYYYSFIIFYGCAILFLLIQNLFFTSLSERFLPNAIFILSPLLFLTLILPYFHSEKIHEYVRLLFVVNIFIFFYEEGTDLVSVLTNPGNLKTALISSEFPTESNLAYPFGFFLIYFFVEKYPD